MTNSPFWPEIQQAIARLHEGTPLGEVIASLTDINNRAIVESYCDGLSLRQCGKLHGVPWWSIPPLIHRADPGLMRPSNRPPRKLKEQRVPSAPPTRALRALMKGREA